MNNRPQEILSTLADTISTSILDALGASSVESIFLSGGVAEDRIACFENNGFLEIYSDLDIFVVVAPGVDLAGAKSAARSVIPGLPLDTGAYRLFRFPDIGVYDEGDLLSQPARPGTVEIPLHFRMLYGREDIVRRTRRFDVSAIRRHESLYLLENRLREEAGLCARLKEDASDGFMRSMFYTSLKHCLDVVSALLIAEGRYVCDIDERVRLFESRGTDVDIAPGREAIETIKYARTHLRNLQAAMRSERERFETVRRQSEMLLLTTWKSIAAAIFEKGRWTGWDELLERRLRAESPARALKESIVVSRRCGRPLMTGVSLWTKRPRARVTAALRCSGLGEILAQRGGTELGAPPDRFIAYLNAVTFALGDAGDGLFDRSRKLFERLS
jgi:hypothetical protein